MSTARHAQQELEKTEQPIEDAFLSAVQATVAASTIAGVVSAISSISDIMQNVGLGRPVLSETLEKIREAYKRGGQFEAPEARINFDMRNPRAEEWLREQSSRFITQITDEQREAIRAVLRAGMEQGRNPKQTALDIVGRVDSTGRRKGGIVGLTGKQAEYVANARAQLRSGDPEQMAKYLSRSRRDKRFDATVRRYAEQNRPVPMDMVEKIASRYSQRLLALRGEMIARTESLQAFSQARDEAYEQAIDSGQVSADNITKTWRDSSDARVRHSHRALDGITVAKGDLFVSPLGSRLAFPGDISHGALPADIIGCRCMASYRIDHFAEANR